MSVMLGAVVLVALGGVSGGYAARLIGSGQIKDNSIQSRDITDGTLTWRDLRWDEQRRLQSDRDEA